MTKVKVFFIVLAIILIGAGVAAVSVAYAKGYRIEEDKDLVTNTIEISDDFTSIDADMISSLEIVKGDSAKAEVTESDKITHELKVVDGTLKITSTDNTKWYQKYFIFTSKYKVKLYVTKDTFENLNVKSAVGTVVIKETLEFNKVNIENNTGSVNLEELTANTINIKQDTGSLNMKNITVTGNLDIDGETGSVNLTGVNASTIKISLSTASINLIDTFAVQDIRLNTSTGSIRFDNIDGANIYMESSTGSIRGSIATPKIFVATSQTSRSVEVPNTTTGGRCEAKTSTGSIKITLK